MKIQTTRFGEIEIAKELVIKFPGGMPGFPDEEQFVLFPYEKDSPFSFLQSLSNPNLTFLLADPFRFFNDYVFNLDDELAAQWGFSSDNSPCVYTVATMKDSLEKMTVNLLAPIVVNWVTRKGTQLIIENKNYSVQQRLFPDGLKGRE